jgi:AcrR family transcriptional regulator
MNQTREALLKAATSAFAEHGYRGASVRDICARAGASANGVTYHFGSKKKLYQEILSGFLSRQLDVTERVLSQPPSSADEFTVRLEVFFSQLLDSYLENRETIRILMREFEQLLPQGVDGVLGRFVRTSEVITAFIAQAIELGFVSADVEADIVAGILLDRVVNQARFADAQQKFFGVTTLDDAYRLRWVQATLRIVVHGMSGPNPRAN